LGVWLNVFLQNRVGAAKKSVRPTPASFSKEKLLNLAEHLRTTIGKLKLNARTVSSWSNYYEETILSNEYLQSKEKIFSDWIEDIHTESALDLGCNDGYFSKMIARRTPSVVASDFDELCINRLYQAVKTDKIHNILPLCIDIANPSPAIGFRNEERTAFLQRGQSQLVIALALIHHLVLSHNIPFSLLAEQFAALTTQFLIIEFVPLTDEKSKQLVADKTSFHQPYDESAFEQCFGHYFVIEQKQIIPGSQRVLYRMQKK